MRVRTKCLQERLLFILCFDFFYIFRVILTKYYLRTFPVKFLTELTTDFSEHKSGLKSHFLLDAEVSFFNTFQGIKRRKLLRKDAERRRSFLRKGTQKFPSLPSLSLNAEVSFFNTFQGIKRRKLLRKEEMRF